jgi:hypothetical protein
MAGSAPISVPQSRGGSTQPHVVSGTGQVPARHVTGISVDVIFQTSTQHRQIASFSSCFVLRTCPLLQVSRAESTASLLPTRACSYELLWKAKHVGAYVIVFTFEESKVSYLLCFTMRLISE